MRLTCNKYCYWRILAVICIALAWGISLSSLGGPLYSKIIPKPNISQNEILLEKLNLSNITVLCTFPYTYSSGKQTCQLKCGLVYFLGNYVTKRVIYGIIGVVNIGITVIAIIRCTMIRKELKFQDHPIFIGILCNLVLALLLGIPDMIGIDIFYCENRDIGYDTLHTNPPLQLHIVGALITIFGISTRLWFVMAIALILISVSFPMKDVFGSKRNRIVILTLEIVICIVYPCVCALAPFTPFTGYKLSEEVLFPVAVNLIVSLICEIIPHTLISAVTISIVVLIIYMIHSQMQMGADKVGKPQTVHPIEKRLMFFSVFFFIMVSIISVSLITQFVRENQQRHEINDFLATLTLKTAYRIYNSSSVLNQTLTLLTPEDQLLVQDNGNPFIFEYHGLTIRMIFILVLPVLNFPCNKLRCKKKEKSLIKQESNKVV